MFRRKLVATWGSVFEWIRQDEELSARFDEREANMFLTLNPHVLELWSAATSYQGFDIKRILTLMRSHSLIYARDTLDQIINQ